MWQLWSLFSPRVFSLFGWCVLLARSGKRHSGESVSCAQTDIVIGIGDRGGQPESVVHKEGWLSVITIEEGGEITVRIPVRLTDILEWLQTRKES